MQEEIDNLWLARTLHHLGAVRFGDFSLGKSTLHSPIYVDLKVMLGDPSVLRNAALLIQKETRFGQALLKPKVGWFDVVAGVPAGLRNRPAARHSSTHYGRPRQAAPGLPARAKSAMPGNRRLVREPGVAW